MESWMNQQYRYWLERKWNSGPPQVFVMLNPSTADQDNDDPTIRRCINFAKREGAGGMIVVNLFALRTTDPAQLSLAADPVGPDNTRAIGEALLFAMGHGRPIVCAWGAHRMASDRVPHLVRMVDDFGVAMVCLGVTKDGHPRHPLYVRSTADLIPWPASERERQQIKRSAKKETRQ